MKQHRIILINCFIIIQLFAVLVYQLPASSLSSELGPIIRPYMTLSGFRQGWWLFAPNPYTWDGVIDARITYADGRKRTWRLSGIAGSNELTRYRRMRMSNYVFNGVIVDRMAYLRPDVARYVARTNNIYHNNPPVSVALVMIARHMPAIGAPIPPYAEHVIETTEIAQEDLR